MSLDLRPNEYVKIEVHFSYKVFVFPMLLMSIGILMFLAVWSGVVGNTNVHWMGQVIKLSSLIVLIGLGLFIPYIYKRIDNRLKIYAVTNQRVYIRRGIINIHEKDIPLGKINDVQIMQSLAQRIFAAGNVVIQVGNDESRICIEDVNRPREFRDTVLSAIYELQQEEDNIRQREYQQQQQQMNYNNNQNYNRGYDNRGNYGNYNNQGGYNNPGYNNYGNYNNQGGYNNQGYNHPGEYDDSEDYNNQGGFNQNRY
ncbi:MAG: PH domain-containing protein [Alphaproteobacteria bacterium]|nr:PH domain-containing protein [Alphaproteobacteria bacterium]